MPTNKSAIIEYEFQEQAALELVRNGKNTTAFDLEKAGIAKASVVLRMMEKRGLIFRTGLFNAGKDKENKARVLLGYSVNIEDRRGISNGSPVKITPPVSNALFAVEPKFDGYKTSRTVHKNMDKKNYSSGGQCAGSIRRGFTSLAYK